MIWRTFSNSHSFNRKKMFTFKANDDSWVDVIEVLNAPVMNNRGRYTFSLAVPVKE